MFALPLRGKDYSVNTDSRTHRFMTNKHIKIVRRADKDLDNGVMNKSIADYIVQTGSRKTKVLHVQSLMKTKGASLNNDVNAEHMQIVKPNEVVDI